MKNVNSNKTYMVAIFAMLTASVSTVASAEEMLASSTSQTSEVAAPIATASSEKPSSSVQIVIPANVVSSSDETAELQKQPVTVIEASPLTVSKADELRKMREQTEVETEQRLVEKLEQSRMEDEKKRQAAILGSISATEATEPKAAVEVKNELPAPAPVAAPVEAAPVLEVAKPSPSIEEVRNAVHEELSAVKEQNDKAESESHPHNFVSATVGMLGYGSADVQTIGAGELTFGKMYDDRWAIEFGVGAANAYVDESIFLYRKMNQFNAGVGTRFLILTGRVRPSLGFRVDYIHRSYSEARDLSLIHI